MDSWVLELLFALVADVTFFRRQSRVLRPFSHAHDRSLVFRQQIIGATLRVLVYWGLLWFSHLIGYLKHGPRLEISSAVLIGTLALHGGHQWVLLGADEFQVVVLLPALEELFYRETLLMRLYHAEPQRFVGACVLQAFWFALNHHGPTQTTRLFSLRVLRGALYGMTRLWTGRPLTGLLVHIINNISALAFGDRSPLQHEDRSRNLR